MPCGIQVGQQGRQGELDDQQVGFGRSGRRQGGRRDRLDLTGGLGACTFVRLLSVSHDEAGRGRGRYRRI